MASIGWDRVTLCHEDLTCSSPRTEKCNAPRHTIGAGGMGEVYKATGTRLERTVAIKVRPAHIASDPVVVSPATI